MLVNGAHVKFSRGTISFYGPSVAVLQAIAPGFFFLTQEKYALASGENIFLPPFSEILHFFRQKRSRVKRNYFRPSGRDFGNKEAS